MRKTRFYFAVALLLLTVSGHASGALNVVVSLKPVHSLVSALMQGVAEPKLLLTDAQSPHSMVIKPSQMRMLKDADLIVWIGPALEPSLSRLLNPGRYQAETVRLIDTPNLHLLPIREHEEWHSHGHDHRHEEADATPDHPTHDLHIWLSPENAAQMVRYLTQIVIAQDKPHREQYMKNSHALLTRLQTLDDQIRTALEAVKDRPYVVFHDAYQYFEAHYGLNVAGSVNIDPDRLSGPRHIHRLQETIRRTNAHCIFSEPQFEPKLVHTLVEELGLGSGELDPLGKQLATGPDSYFMLMQGLSESLIGCLARETQQ
ncbi:MAG: zinc ABC transporter substrate-binding protein [Candidatus Thiodiazotropha sp.]